MNVHLNRRNTYFKIIHRNEYQSFVLKHKKKSYKSFSYDNFMYIYGTCYYIKIQPILILSNLIKRVCEICYALLISDIIQFNLSSRWTLAYPVLIISTFHLLYVIDPSKIFWQQYFHKFISSLQRQYKLFILMKLSISFPINLVTDPSK